MDLKRMMQLQDDFDREHCGWFEWSASVTEESLGVLAFLLVAVSGEVGELANVVKRVLRGDESLAAAQPQIEDEVADVFIYLLKLCNQMDINLERAFMTKLQRNKTRFKQYERGLSRDGRYKRVSGSYTLSDLARLNTVKAQPEMLVDRFTSELVSELAGDCSLEHELREFLGSVGIYFEEEKEKFLAGVVLSCVLADIGTQLSSEAKAANTAKVEAICARRGLPFRKLMNTSAYADDLLQLMERCGASRQSARGCERTGL